MKTNSSIDRDLESLSECPGKCKSPECSEARALVGRLQVKIERLRMLYETEQAKNLEAAKSNAICLSTSNREKLLGC